MASIKSNLNDITGVVKELGNACNLKRQTRGGSEFGRVLIHQIAMDIVDQTANRQKDPDNKRLRKLKPKYRAWKLANGYDGRIGIKTGAMLQEANMEGKVLIGERVAMMEYHGEGDVDQVADYFQSAGREFYGIPPQSEEKLDNLTDVQIDYVIKELGG